MIPEKRALHLQQFMTQLHISLQDTELLSLALTHPSFLTGGTATSANNQRLEFLGDAVVDLAIGQYLYDTYPERPEGDLTKMRAALVCEATLANAAKRVGLGEYLIMGNGELANGGKMRASNLADAMEAVMAVVYLEHGVKAVQQILLENIRPELARVAKGHYGDYKSQLQEYVQRDPSATITYTIVREEGPSHARTFTAAVMINKEQVAIGTGNSKKEAEQAAAFAALISYGELEE